MWRRRWLPGLPDRRRSPIGTDEDPPSIRIKRGMKQEHIAVQEARNLGITVVAPLDTNCDPDVIDIAIPGNDDAIRSIQLFCKEMAEAINEGKALANGGNDAAAEEVVAEEAPVAVEAAAEEVVAEEA